MQLDLRYHGWWLFYYRFSVFVVHKHTHRTDTVSSVKMSSSSVASLALNGVESLTLWVWVSLPIPRFKGKSGVNHRSTWDRIRILKMCCFMLPLMLPIARIDRKSAANSLIHMHLNNAIRRKIEISGHGYGHITNCMRNCMDRSEFIHSIVLLLLLRLLLLLLRE